MVSPSSSGPVRVLDRYALFDEIAAGGMATVHIGRLMGPVGFNRTVAIKRLHPMYAKDAEFVSMFLDEARLASRIRHPNVVQTVDVVAKEGELFLVMEFVLGESLARLMSNVRNVNGRIPLDVMSGIASGFLNGLHAAHEAKNERGVALNLVHRDVSPQNVLVGTDGVARALDFGVAKAVTQVHSTRDGQLKGKLGYMAPEQLEGQTSRATDVYASAVVIWEGLAGQRLFSADNERAVLGKLLAGAKEPPSRHNPEVPAELDAVIMRGLSVNVSERYPTALEMARAIAKIVPSAHPVDIGEWVEQTARQAIEQRAAIVARIEAMSAPASGVASRLAAAAATGTDPRLVLDSNPPPAGDPPGAAPARADAGLDSEGMDVHPDKLLGELFRQPLQAPSQPQPRHGSGDGMLTKPITLKSIRPPASPVVRRAALVGAAVGGALLVLGVLRLTKPASSAPAASAHAMPQAPSAAPSTPAAPAVSAEVASPAASVAPAPAPVTKGASPSASASAPQAGVPPRVAPLGTAERHAPTRHGAQPRVDDALLQTR